MTTTSGAGEARLLVHHRLLNLHVLADAAANAVGGLDLDALADFTGPTLDRVATELAEPLPFTAFEPGSPERERRYLRDLRTKLTAERGKTAKGGIVELDARLARRSGGDTELAKRLNRRSGF